MTQTRFTPSGLTQETAARIERVAPGGIHGELRFGNLVLPVIQVQPHEYVAEQAPSQTWKTLMRLERFSITGAAAHAEETP